MALSLFANHLSFAGGIDDNKLPTLKVLVPLNGQYVSYRTAEGHLEGFHVDVARTICSSLKVKCIIHDVAFKETINILERNDADIAVSGLTVKPDRIKRILFSNPYVKAVTFWISEKNIDSSENFKVAAVEGTTQQEWVVNQAEKHKWNVLPMTSPSELIDSFFNKNSNAVVASKSTAVTIMQKADSMGMNLSPQVLSGVDPTDDRCIGISPRRPDLVEKINNILFRLKKTGELDSINYRHFPYIIF